MTYMVIDRIAANTMEWNQSRPAFCGRAVTDHHGSHQAEPDQQHENDDRRMVPGCHHPRGRDVDHFVQRRNQGDRRLRGRFRRGAMR